MVTNSGHGAPRFDGVHRPGEQWLCTIMFPVKTRALVEFLVQLAPGAGKAFLPPRPEATNAP